MDTQPTLFDIIGRPSYDAATFTANVARFFIAHENQWIPATALEAVGGRQAWRTRVSDCRKVYGMRIDNRCRRIVEPDGRTWTLSEYRYVSEGSHDG